MRTLVLAAALVVAGLVLPAAGQAQSLTTPTDPADPSKSCPDLAAEISRMEQILGMAQSAETTARVAETGASVAVNAAAYSGALGSVPMLGGLLQAGSGLARMATEVDETTKKNAELRRYYLIGLRHGKTCG